MANWASAPGDDKYGYADCLQCGVNFKKVIPWQKYCSDYHGRLFWAKNNRDKIRAKNKRQREGFTPLDHRRFWMKKKYGITLAQYDEMLEKQGGVCDICGSPPPEGTYLHVDHRKGTKPAVVRGLLCKQCNLAIGYLRDVPANAVSAAAYLRKTAVL